MAVKYIPYYPDTIEGQAILDNFVRTRRMLKYRDNDKAIERIKRGMPLYEMEKQETVGDNKNENLIIRGECLSACAYLKEQGKTVDLVYIDPPFASGADYAKKVYIRRNPKVAEAIAKVETEEELKDDDLKAFEEKMYGDVWDKEKYLNWMYENLMAIKSVMSETASIYVHLDWHIVHYVKILMDEVFGEDNFRNDISWHYSGWNKKLKTSFEKRHDTILYYCADDEGENFNSYFEQWESEEEYVKRRKQKPLIDTDGRRYVLSDAGNGNRVKRYLDEAIREGVVIDDVWDLDKMNNSANEAVDYTTQKPEALLERIIKASSNEGMTVADFFGGSGVTAAVAAKLGRKFIHCDVGINSIQTARDRLITNKAAFDILEIKDGVSLYRNPMQTMDKLKLLIPGLCNQDSLDKFWEGAIISSKEGTIPVYIPNLMDSSTKLLDIVLMNRILREAMPDLPDDTRRVIVYYIDITDRTEIEKFIVDNNNTLIDVELRDLKEILDEVVVEDYAEFAVSEYKPKSEVFQNGFKVEILRFASDRVQRKIEEYNQKGQVNILRGEDQQEDGSSKKEKKFKPITISETGLELIEHISLDCTATEGVWHSDSEIKIDKLGYVIKNGTKTKDFWDGCVYCENKPLRIKIRNICGDETINMVE
ncbi:MAG: site-specific DNA-methyltransferase [Candidatus Symbiothrix sp.]|jgi:adenine-specific DNA-methyltransferase|nr:site-specific DNA-methyltransferase [Candidatus Symbiothrix sp.]